MVLRFSQKFWRQKFSINTSLDIKLNFILSLFNKANQIALNF